MNKKKNDTREADLGRDPVGPLLGSHLFAVLRLSRRTDRGKQHCECRYKKMFRFHNFKI